MVPPQYQRRGTERHRISHKVRQRDGVHRDRGGDIAGLVVLAVFGLGIPAVDDPPAQTASHTRPWHPQIQRCRCLRHAWGAAAATCACGNAAVSLTMKLVGKPDAGNPPVRFDERGWETERWP